MSIHSKNWHGSRQAETEYASGAGASAFDQTKLAGGVSGLAYPRSFGDNMYPMQKISKEKLESQDDNAYGGIYVDDAGWESIESSREEYIQDAFYLDKLIAYLAAGQGSDLDGLSYALHWQDHIRAGSAADNLRYESYGIFVKKLAITIPTMTGKKDGFPYWVVEEACYSTKYDTGAGATVDSLAKTSWLSIGGNAPATLGSFTIGGSAVNNIEGTLAITVKYDETKEGGEKGLKYPYFLGVDIEFTCKFRNYTQYKAFIVNLLKEPSAETRYTVKITSGLAACFPQVTNMMLRDGDLNRIPKAGMVEYSLTFISTDTSVLTKESS